MIRDNKDVAVVIDAWPSFIREDDIPGMTSGSQVLMCRAFNTETGAGALALVPGVAQAPRYILLSDEKIKNDCQAGAPVNLQPTAEEARYLRDFERGYKRQQREVLDVFGANGVIGYARAWLRIAFWSATGAKPAAARGYGAPLPQRPAALPSPEP